MENKKLTSVFDLVKRSFGLYFKGENLGYFVKIILLILAGVVLGIIPMIVFFGASGFFQEKGFESMSSTYTLLIMIIFWIFFMVLSAWAGATYTIAASQVVGGRIIGVRETFKVGWQRAWKYFATQFLVGFTVLGGLILFIIPGVIFGLWFSFSLLFAVVEENNVVESMKKSKELVSGYFWPILGRFTVITLIVLLMNLVLSFIPFIGPLITMFIGPFSFLFYYLVFEDLKRVKLVAGPIKGSEQPAPESVQAS